MWLAHMKQEGIAVLMHISFPCTTYRAQRAEPEAHTEKLNTTDTSTLNLKTWQEARRAAVRNVQMDCVKKISERRFRNNGAFP
eukprot:5647881-Prymnesium_polylepis.1